MCACERASPPVVDKDLLPALYDPRRPQAAGDAEPGAGHEVEGGVGAVELVVRLQERLRCAFVQRVGHKN